MKTILALAIAGSFLASTGCEQQKPVVEEDSEVEKTIEKMINEVEYGDAEIIVIEGCEYIVYKEGKGTNQGYGFMAHKGNCNNPIHNHKTIGTVKDNNNEIK